MQKHKILIIDYEPRWIKALTDPLEEAGFSIEVATDGQKGIEAFHRLKPDLTLIEAMLPRRHGFEVCQELKKTPHGSRTPIVIVTSVYRGRKYRSQAIHHHGCDEFLEKPIPAQKLLETVNLLLAGRVPQATEPVTISPEPPEARDADAEREIMERLDSILPGDDGGGKNVVSFDPERSRRRRDERTQSAPAKPPATNGTRHVNAAAETVPEPPALPAKPVPASTPERNASPRRSAQPAVVVRVDTPNSARGWMIWLMAGLLAVLGVTLVYIFIL